MSGWTLDIGTSNQDGVYLRAVDNKPVKSDVYLAAMPDEMSVWIALWFLPPTECQLQHGVQDNRYLGARWLPHKSRGY